jgi:hypothetical protein
VRTLGFAGNTPWLSSPAPVASLLPFQEMTWGAIFLAVTRVAMPSEDAEF